MSTTDDFRLWVGWFRENDAGSLPFESHVPLAAATRDRIAGPLRMFQRGESSDARHLLHKVSRYAYRTGQVDYYRAVECLIAEEHRHADWLGRFMDAEGIPRARSNWLDAAFRRTRHALPLRGTISMLLVAEIIAQPFYQALRDATPSPILKAICKQILADEALHLRFQAHSLRQFRQELSSYQQAGLDVGARAALKSALPLVWLPTNDLFLDTGWDFPTLYRSCHTQFEQVWAIVRGDAPLTAPLIHEFDQRRAFLQAAIH